MLEQASKNRRGWAAHRFLSPYFSAGLKEGAFAIPRKKIRS